MFFFGFKMFSMSIIQVLVDAADSCEDGKVIKCDFKPGSVERSIDLHQRGVPQQSTCSSRRYLQSPPPIKIEQFSQWA
jgi:hypothetical protein